MVEHDVIRERLRLLDEYMTDLSEVQGTDFATYEDNKVLRRYIERTLQMAIEACLDIGQHIVAVEGLRTPIDNKDVFAVLVEAGVVPEPQLENLVSMAKFRNLIVHEYERIDNAVVFGVFRRRQSDFHAYARAIAAYLESQDTD